MASDHPHPRLQHFKSDAFQQERQALDDNDADFGRDDVLRIRALLAKLRFAFSVEQAVEAEHAKIKSEVDCVPHHSDALVSLAHRIGAVREYIKDSEARLEEFATLADKVKDGRRACVQLGLQDQPQTLAAIGTPRHPDHFKVVYHADTWATYTTPAPPIVIDHLDFCLAVD